MDQVQGMVVVWPMPLDETGRISRRSLKNEPSRAWMRCLRHDGARPAGRLLRTNGSFDRATSEAD
jgi:hypothetical protein